jgi:hypothetical protein
VSQRENFLVCIKKRTVCRQGGRWWTLLQAWHKTLFSTKASSYFSLDGFRDSTGNLIVPPAMQKPLYKSLYPVCGVAAGSTLLYTEKSHSTRNVPVLSIMPWGHWASGGRAQCILNSVLYGDEWSASRSGRHVPWERDPQHTLNTSLGWQGKDAAPSGSQMQTVPIGPWSYCYLIQI